MVTGLKNRLSLEKAMQIVYASFANKQNEKSSLILMEIDDLRAFHVKHGYKVGDEVFESLATFLNKSIRPVDVVGRFNSGLVAILLPHIKQDKAVKYAQAISQRIADMSFSTSAGALKLTMSFGVAELKIHDDPLKDWLGRADRALFDAQKEGSNIVKGAD